MTPEQQRELSDRLQRAEDLRREMDFCKRIVSNTNSSHIDVTLNDWTNGNNTTRLSPKDEPLRSRVKEAIAVVVASRLDELQLEYDRL